MRQTWTEITLKNVVVVLFVLFEIGVPLGIRYCEASSAVGERDGMSATGPLKVHSRNPRYFADASGKAIYLTGSHYWYNFQDDQNRTKIAPFNYVSYLDFLKRYNHNFIRQWSCEQAAWSSWTIEKTLFDPLPFQRTGPGNALDGGLRFDLTAFNQAYFDRLRSRVIAARDRGIYVAIMLFQGWSIEKKEGPGNPWPGHPFNINNNINGINGDANGDAEGKEVHTLLLPAVVTLQEGYVRKVIDTVNDLDNVLYEIANESHSGSDAWQNHMIDFIHAYEVVKPKQHPVIYSAAMGYDGTELWRSHAEAISPGWPSKDPDFVPYRDNPPLNDGRKIIINDTDHLWGMGGDHQWVWKSFLRGLNPIFMDPYTAREHQNHPSKCEWELIRKNMGYTLSYSRKIDLAAMVPRSDLCSTKYCLANPGREYLIYLPSDHQRRLRWFYGLRLNEWLAWTAKFVGLRETASVDLPASSQTYRVEWFNPSTGETMDGGTSFGGANRSYTPPFAGDAVLYIYRP